MTCRQRCDGCPLQDRKVVPGHGRRNGLMIIGDFTRSWDAHTGRPMSGRQGDLLKEVLKQVGINKYQVFYTNAVICHAGQNQKPSVKMVEACRANLLQEIIDVNPTKILTVGSLPLKALFGQDARISKVRGLGQYVEIPVSYKDAISQSWHPVWVKKSQMHSPLDTGEQYQIAGSDKNGSLWMDVEHPLEEKQYKNEIRYQLYRKKVTIVQEPDETRSIFTVATYHPSYILEQSPDSFREFALDLEKIARQDAPLPAPRIDTWITRTVEETVEALEMISRANVLGCDTETTGLDPQTAELLSIGFGALIDVGGYEPYDGVAVIIPRELVYDQQVFDAVQSILDGTQHKGTLVFHNIKFDAQILHHAGYKMTHPNFSDSMMLSYHWDERPSLPDEQGEAGGGKPQGRSLKTLARVFYDIPDYHFDFPDFYQRMYDATLSDDDWTKLYTYHGLDCVLTARLYFDMKQRLDEESPKLYPLAQNITVPACLTFAAVEYRGIKIDQPYLTDLRVTYDEKRNGYFEELQTAWNGIGKTTELNAGSWQQIQALLEGHRIFVESTKRDPLLHWKATTAKDDPRRELIDNLIAYRLYTMMINTFIDGMLKRVDKSSRLHTSYLIDGTATGRISSQNPNLQNIPQRMGKDIRRAFIASDGMVFLNADYSQVQVRIAASKLFANDTSMREAYLNRDDIYKVVASKMYHITKEEITKQQRQYAKTIVLGTLFEQSAHGIVQGREMALMKDAGNDPWSKEEAQFFQNEFFKEFPGFKEYMDRQHALGKQHRYVEDPLGRRRRFPFIAPGMLGHFERQTGNSPIQAGEAEVLLTGINRLHRIFDQNKKAFIVLSVHDSITSEVYPEHVREIADIITDTLENNSVFETDIPFRIDVECGPNWADMEPLEELVHG